ELRRSAGGPVRTADGDPARAEHELRLASPSPPARSCACIRFGTPPSRPCCGFPGCGLLFGQGHHIRHWAHGGLTTLSNLSMLCRRHHRAVHEDGYAVERLADG